MPSLCRLITCGDGYIETGETCDDQNLSGGCVSCTTILPGFYCTGSYTVLGSCVTHCGDGIIAGNETCDNNNNTALDYTDGCFGANCTVVPGFNCTGVPVSTNCNAICGDGLKMNTENCDDGNYTDIHYSAGCVNCVTEPGWVCSGGTHTSPDTCTATCGDGRVYRPPEACDDGNIASTHCLSCTSMASGWYCTGGTPTSPDTCITHCGDGIIAGTE